MKSEVFPSPRPPEISIFTTTSCAAGCGNTREDPAHAFPGAGQMKPEQAEIAQLKKEIRKLKAERDILKKAAAYFAKD